MKVLLYEVSALLAVVAQFIIQSLTYVAVINCFKRALQHPVVVIMPIIHTVTFAVEEK